MGIKNPVKNLRKRKIQTRSRDREANNTFWGHIHELRLAVLLSFGIIIFALLSHPYHEAIIRFILRPLKGEGVIFLSPLDPILFIFQVDTAMGVLLGLPFVLFLVFRFIAPAINPKLLKKQ